MELRTDLDLKLDMDLVLWCQGDDPSGRIQRGEQVELNGELLAQARQLIQPAFVYDVFPLVEVQDDAVVLDGQARFHGHLLADRFVLAEEVALALCTIGGGLEEQVSVYRTQGEETRAILLDGIGTAAVGRLAEIAHDLIRAEAAGRGWKASAAFQPGQIDWPLEDHGVFFHLLMAETLGLTLGSNHLMVPSKSVSLAVGLGEEMLPLAMERACKHCAVRNECRFRRD